MAPPTKSQGPTGSDDAEGLAGRTQSSQDEGVPFSQSILWRLQREFYAQHGFKAWTEDLVPSYITSNPLIAEIYAAIVAGFLSDCQQQPDQAPLSPQHPLRIVELGAGPGKFACLFLRKLTALLREKNLAQHLIHYVMSDCAEEVLAAWRGNRYLREFADQDILEFQLLRADEDHLADVNEEKNQSRGPLVVIANYVFDSLPQDAFAISKGEIAEMLLTVTGDKTSVSPSSLSFRSVPVPAERYADPVWNQILERYRTSLAEATVLFPCAALKVLQQLGSMSDGRMLVLAADKGFVYEDELPLSRGAPALEFHSANCFSQQVNFDAIARYFLARGGQALLPEKHFSSLSICAFLLHGGQPFSATSACYRSAQAQMGPDDVFALLGWLHSHMEEMTIAQILAMLRLSRWDPVALIRIFPVLARQLGTAGAARHDLREAVMRVWENRFPVTTADKALAFDCGVILLELGFHADALSMFQESVLMLGRSAATSYNLGLCAERLANVPDALKYMKDALAQDTGFAAARNALRKLEAENPSA